MDTDNYSTMSKEIQKIVDNAHTLVNATGEAMDDRIKSARDALKESLHSFIKNQESPCTGDYGKKINKKMQEIIDYAHALVEATSGDVDDKIKSARLALKERLDSAKSEYQIIEDRLRDKVHTTDQLIHTKPYFAIGGTFVAGLFLGWFMSRK